MSADRSVKDRLFILAFDHRGSFEEKLFGLSHSPTPAERVRIADAKMVIYEGFLEALERGAPRASAGVLVDEEYGADIARRAKAAGTVLAMPVEKSGQDVFEFEYGDDFRAHVEAFEPTFVKALVRYNPQAADDANRRQVARLATLSDWLASHSRKLLLELLVPPTQEELEDMGGVDSYDHGMRPQLVLWAIAEMQAAGIEPAVWKIEGIDRRHDCERIAAQARSDGRDQVRCVVLGRGADQARVEHWLQEGAGATGFAGFAIGRTIWFDPLASFLRGELDRGQAIQDIAGRYLHAIETYEGGAVNTPAL